MFSLGKFATLVLAAIASTSAMTTHQQGASKVGSDRTLSLTAPANQVFSHLINQEGATYVAPHFDFLNIPAGGVLEISDLDGSQKVRYTGSRTDFYAEYVRGSVAVLTYYPPATDTIDVDVEVAPSVAFKVDRFASGFPSGIGGAIEAICGTDDTKAAVCLKDSDPVKYQKAQAVARLLIGGSSLCTGWLFGSEGHMITNNHCIGDAATAANIQFEFKAECATCSDPNNTKQLACPGETVATSAQFIYTHEDYDFTLVKLNVKAGVDISKYGYLQARASGPVLNEQIYIPQHPAGKPTRIATVVDNGSVGTIEKFSIASCSPDEVGYTLDTEGGSSGSPVLSVSENVVVALHNCGGCHNGAIKIDKVVSQLQTLGYLPANAVAGNNPPPVTTQPVTPTTTKAPTAAPTTTKATTKPVTTKPSVCGTCRYCYYPAGKSCLSSFTKSDCAYYAANYGTVWCGI